MPDYPASVRPLRASASGSHRFPVDRNHWSFAADSKTTNTGATDGMMPMQIVAPLFVEDADFTSTLVIVNAANADEFADVSVRGLDGRVLVSRQVDLSPHSQRRLELGTLLKSSQCA